MKLTFKKTLACLLALSMVFTMSFGVSAADKKNDTAHKVDNILDSILDGALGLSDVFSLSPKSPLSKNTVLKATNIFMKVQTVLSVVLQTSGNSVFLQQALSPLSGD